ncbi:MAG: hypothetical protein IJJ28_02390 [Lentisphaeria bacterium]|nr:hypothetical protein [Lentisphaeria bacterium]
MNRAILIVICDFLVSAMLSMMTGMVPAHTGGTGVGLDEQTTRTLLAEMNANLNALERMRELLRRTARQNGGPSAEQERKLHELAERIVSLRRDAELLTRAQDKRPLAKLTAKQLQLRLEAELRQRMRAELELKEQREDLAGTTRELKELRRDFSATTRSVAELTRSNTETQRHLERSREELRRTEDALAESQSARRSTEDALKEKSRELERAGADLADVRKALKDMNARVGQSAAESGALRQTLAFTSGQLDSATRQAAELKDQLARTRRSHNQVVLERDEARNKQEELKRLVRTTVQELSQARKAAEESRVEKAEAVGKLTAVTAQLKEAKRKLGNHVLQCYGNGAVALEVAVREERLMGEQRGGGTYYLPLVELGGQSFLVGHLDQFAGDRDRPLAFNRVTQAAMFVSTPGAKTAGQPLAGPVLLAPGEIRMAAVRTQLGGRKPLKALTLEQLRERGVQELYLFKADSFGRDSAELEGRCSLDVSNDVPYIFIRNSVARSELKAEPGDLILTREGDYAAIVIDTLPRGFAKGDVARAFVFPNRAVWNNARRIPYEKPRDAKYFDDFARAVRETKATLNHRSRRR